MADMATPTAPEAPVRRGADWLESWTPEDPENWDSGRAWKTLWVTTFNLTLAFATWFLVSALAPKLNNIGYDLSKSQLYWLVAIPGPGRRHIAPDLDVPAPDHGHPQAGDDHLGAVRPARHRLGPGSAEPGHPVRRAAVPGRARGHRRRRVLRVHALDVVLLPQGQAGHRPGPTGGPGQLRSQPRAVRHPLDRRVVDRGRIAALHRCEEGRRQGGLVPERRLHLGSVHHRRRDPRVDPAAQRPGPGPRCEGPDGHLQQQAHVADDRPLRDHLRDVLRPGRPVRPADQEPVRRRRVRGVRDRRGEVRVLGRAHRLSSPDHRRPDRRPCRRREGHAGGHPRHRRRPLPTRRPLCPRTPPTSSTVSSGA